MFRIGQDARSKYGCVLKDGFYKDIKEEFFQRKGVKGLRNGTLDWSSGKSRKLSIIKKSSH